MIKKLYTTGDYFRELNKEPIPKEILTENYRDHFRRDYARLIHSPAFRRLQGKTQLFPGLESDFFRNRLTHSLEVAQIAKSIGIRINALYNKQGQKKQGNETNSFGLSLDVIEFAGLAHDLGHPPFGHQGEEALDICMRNDSYGGFEGNAQTIRILSRMEKKFNVENYGFDNGKDNRFGLNLCMRTLASVLKYDFRIPEAKEDRVEIAKSKGEDEVRPVKGYYSCDSDLVQKIKEKVLAGGTVKEGKFKTVECYIMDIADDIAYSTYDLEDGFKAGFISPMDLLYASKEILEEVCEQVNKNLKKEEVNVVLKWSDIPQLIESKILNFSDLEEQHGGQENLDFGQRVNIQYSVSKLISKDGSWRTPFTSTLVGIFIRGTELVYDPDNPCMSKVRLNDETRILVEVLKTFTYMSQIMSPRLKIAEFRGKEIVTKIFNTLVDNPELMPEDYRKVYERTGGNYQKRIICDFISSMTDRYAIEFYGRLTSENPKTIFKPF